ncbi:MAG: hypothetical protein N2Z80_03285, partial [Hydrogenothermaceae bacterium]|nr:hypothetical protein [Hydrogenothermaceae bacterium]
KKKFHTFTLVLISLILILLLRSLETYGIYIDSSIDWGEERTSNYFKAFVITTYLVLTTFLISKNFLMSNTFLYEIYLFRLNYAIFILPFSLLTGEGFARLLFFFYAIDILYVMSLFLLKRKSIRERIALSFSFLFYGISSNAINILKQAVGSS